jgi:D-alanyl-D-alanine dipeptidase
VNPWSTCGPRHRYWSTTARPTRPAPTRTCAPAWWTAWSPRRAYRPLATQERYFREYHEQLRRAHPDWSTVRLSERASRYIAPPPVAPHVAGAAVDLTLCTEDGRELPMGTSVNASPEASGGRCYTDSPAIPPAAREHRDLLCGALRAVHFVNYPSEWWHWSYGDRYWAFMTGAASARYGPIATLAEQ